MGADQSRSALRETLNFETLVGAACLWQYLLWSTLSDSDGSKLDQHMIHD